MVRCFEDNDIVHVNGKVDPKSDIDVINLELVFSDMDQVFVTILLYRYGMLMYNLEKNCMKISQTTKEKKQLSLGSI